MTRRDFVVGAAAMAAVGEATAAPAGKDAWKREQRDGVVQVSWNGRPLLAYQSAPVTGPPGTPPLLTRSGYIHPFHAPNGAVVTDDFSDSHPHQRGVFFAWTKTRIVLDGEELHPDFWNLGSGTARVRSRTVPSAEPRPEGMLLRAQHAWEVRQRDTWREVLDEEWEILARPPAFADPDAPAAAFVVDITSRQTPRFDLDLPQYIYGGMAVRAARQWGQKASLPRVLTSEGKDRVGSDASTARWVDMRGQVEGRECGVALLEHATNPRAPNALRVHPDVPYYVFSLPKTASVRLLAGTTYTFRYRVVAHNGGLSPAGIDTLWQEMSGTQA